MSRLRFRLILLICIILPKGSLFSQSPKPPVCNKRPQCDTFFGTVLQDDYAWLKDRKDPEVLHYLKEENRYTDIVMSTKKRFVKKLFRETSARVKHNDMSVPYYYKGYEYYVKTVKGKEHPVYCRKNLATGSREEILLDADKLVKIHQYYDVSLFSVSPDGKVIAYAVDYSGNFETDIYFVNLVTRQEMPDVLRRVTSMAWAGDNKTIYYTTQDSITNRSNKLKRHMLGKPREDRTVVFYEADPLYDLQVYSGVTEEYIFLDVRSAEQNEVWYMHAKDLAGYFRLIHGREPHHRYHVTDYKDEFYIVSDKEAVNGRLLKTASANPHISRWKEIIPHRDQVSIEDILVLSRCIVLEESHRGVYKLRVINHDLSEEHLVEMPGETGTLMLSTNREVNSQVFRFQYTSFTCPFVVYEYDPVLKERNLVRQYEVEGKFHPEEYTEERIWATGADGTEVPISLVYRKGVVRDGRNPLILEAYGAYGSNFETYYSPDILNYVNRGFIYAVAHVRGGAELGGDWYKQGKLLNKMNSFNDYISCAGHLIREAYTSAGLIAGRGESAGGLLLGAVMNMRPDLFKAVVLDVPFVDLMNTMLDPNIPLTTLEYEEWGNPRDSVYFRYMLSYSPYENVKAQSYPNILITAGLADEQVGCHEPAKFTAKLRSLKTDNNLLLLKVEMKGGHDGASGRYSYYRQMAYEQAFVMSLFGIRE